MKFKNALLALGLQKITAMMTNDQPLRKNILVIDPDEEFCRSVRLYLEESYNVSTRQGLDSIDYSIILNKIDLLIIEADLADEELVHTLNQIRHNHPHVMIILMYIYLPSNKNAEHALIRETDDMIAKPFDVDLLRQKVNALLSNKRTAV